MKRKSIIIQILNKSIKIINNNKIIEYKIKSCINGKVTNRNSFLDTMKDIITQEKINSRLLTDDVNIIIDNTYTEIEIEIIKEIFKELSFHKISFINIKTLFQKEDDEILIQVDDKLIKIFLFDKIYDIKIYFEEYYELLKIYLEKLTNKHSISKIKLFGTYNKINSLLVLEDDLKIPVYVFSKPYDIPLTQLT